MQRGRPPSLSCLTRAVSASLALEPRAGAGTGTGSIWRALMALGTGLSHTFLGEKHRGKQQSKAAVAPDNAGLPPPHCAPGLSPLQPPTFQCYHLPPGQQDLQMSPAQRLGMAKALWEPSPSRPYPTQAGQAGGCSHNSSWKLGASPQDRGSFSGWPGQADTSSSSREMKPPCRTGTVP